MKKFLTFLILLSLWAGSSWGVTITVGTGTSTNRYPLNDFYVYSRSQSLYLASEITTGGTITHLRWYRSDAGANPNAIGTTEIWLMETASTTLTGTDWEGPGTLVASISNIDLGAGGGWYDIDITDFAYSGTSNLLVSVYTQDALYTAPHSYWRYTVTTNYMVRSGNSDYTNPPTMSLSYVRPNIQFEMTLSTSYFTILPTSLTYGYVAYPGSSTEQPYTLSGDNLTAGPVLVTAPAGFGVSLTAGGPYLPFVNVGYTPPTLGATTIFTKFTPLAANTSYSGNITHVGGGATGDIAVSGSSDLFSLYCASAAASDDDEDITNVTFGSFLNNTSACASLTGTQGIATGTANLYSNFTSIPPTNVSRGVTYPVSVEITECLGAPYNHDVRVYIDFNQNGLLSDAGEEFIIWPYTSSNTHIITANIAIPIGAIEGNTLMRVVCKESATNGPCLVSSYGETEDYKINITAPPACVAPSGLTSINVDPYNVILSWTENGTATSWDVEWDTIGFPQGTGTTVNVSTNPTTPLTGLTPATGYDYYVRADCGSGSYSTWTGPYSFITLCDNFTLNVNEGFNDTPECWSVQYVTGVSDIYMASGTSNPTTAPQEGAYYIYWNSYNIATGNESRLVSPPITTTGTPSVDVEFYWMHDAGYPTNDDGVFIEYSTDGTTWIPVDSMIPRYDSVLTGWNLKIVTLPAGAGNQPTVYVGFRFHSAYGNNCSLDNVVIQPTPTCQAPTSLTTTNITAHTAELGWASPDSFFDIFLETYGLPAPDGSTVPTFDNVSGNSYSWTGGIADSTYSWWVRTDCGLPDGTSTWTGPYSFTTAVACPAPTALTITNITYIGADLGWASPDSFFDIFIDVFGGPAPDGSTTPTFDSVPGNSYTWTGGTHSTVYSFWVRTDCGLDGASTWTGPYSFITLCENFTLNITEGFNDTPVCWSVQYVTGASDIYIASSSSDPTTTPQEGTYYIYWNSFDIPTGNESRLVSPPITTTGTPSVDVEFYWMHDPGYPTIGDGVYIEYSTDGTTWIPVGSMIPRYDSVLTGWNLKTITLPAGAGNQPTVYVGFRFHSAYGNNCSLDNVVIQPTGFGLGHVISGKTRYIAKATAGNPAPNSPTYNAAIYNIDQMIVILKTYPGNVELTRDTSDASGVFQFTNVLDGTYMLSYDKYTVDSMQYVNHVNAVDLAVLKYLIGHDTLIDPSRNFTAKHKKAANVDNNASINTVDIARISSKVGLPYTPARNFPKGNWVALDTSVTVAGSDLNITLQTIAYGDYDASSARYKDSLTNWGTAKVLPDENIINRSDESITINNTGYFEVPLQISTKMNELSALGLELSYPNDKYKLVSASMSNTGKKGGAIKINPTLEEIIAANNDLLVTDDQGIIRVVYATTDHFDIAANEELIRFGFRSINDPNQGELDFNLSGTGLIANQYGEINDDAYLVMPKIFVQGNNTEAGFEFAGYPNPFSSDATLTYIIPENGTVKLNIYNAIGELVTELVNETQISGKHEVVFSQKNLSAGMYTFKLEFSGLNESKCLLLKMIH